MSLEVWKSGSLESLESLIPLLSLKGKHSALKFTINIQALPGFGEGFSLTVRR